MQNVTQNIRTILDNIVTPENEKNWCDPLLFKKHILPKLPSELSLVELPAQNLVWQYNCFAFVLHLEHHPELSQPYNVGYIYSPFIKKLIEAGELVRTDNPKQGDIILYNTTEGETEYTHAGFVTEDGLILSKWSGGPLFKHGIFDVPTFYGDHVTYFNPIPKERSYELYEKYKNLNIPD